MILDVSYKRYFRVLYDLEFVFTFIINRKKKCLKLIFMNLIWNTKLLLEIFINWQ